VGALLEKAKDGLALTGDRRKLLALAKLTDRVGKELVVHGDWHSSDHIRVHISSALVEPRKAKRVVRELLREQPMQVGFPTMSEGEDEPGYPMGREKQYYPWIVCPNGEAKLDEYDPFGTYVANRRAHLARGCSSALKLTASDPFGREWKGGHGKVLVRAEAWGRDSDDSERGPHSGTRLFCSAFALQKILKERGEHLILVIAIQRYEQIYRRESKYTHSIAVVRISDALDVEYFSGRINYLYKPRYL